MFRFFLNKIHPTQEQKQKNDDKARVYIWSGGWNSLGHVALQLDGEKPKYKTNDSGNYISIWPKSTPAGGLTSVLPLQAALCKNLEADCIQEAPRPREDFADLIEPFKITPLPPDKVYEIDGLNKDKIKPELNRLEKGIENGGDVRYQLLPGINIAGFFKKIWSKSETKPEVYNCVTLTQHLLEVGGIDKLPDASWTTPSEFGDNLSKQPRVTKSGSLAI